MHVLALLLKPSRTVSKIVKISADCIMFNFLRYLVFLLRLHLHLWASSLKTSKFQAYNLLFLVFSNYLVTYFALVITHLCIYVFHLVFFPCNIGLRYASTFLRSVVSYTSGQLVHWDEFY
jgi:hypothetical protein